MAISKPYHLSFSAVPMRTFISGQFTIGASGAVSASTGRNIKSITKLASGIYRVELIGQINKLLAFRPTIISPTTGAAVNAGSFVSGTLYQITSLGTTNWNAIGLPSYLTAAVGMSFVATGVGSGTGTATAIGSSGITCVELAADPQASLTPNNTTDGATFILQTLAATSGTNTALTPTNPASGTVIRLAIEARMSSNNEE